MGERISGRGTIGIGHLHLKQSELCIRCIQHTVATAIKHIAQGFQIAIGRGVPFGEDILVFLRNGASARWVKEQHTRANASPSGYLQLTRTVAV